MENSPLAPIPLLHFLCFARLQNLIGICFPFIEQFCNGLFWMAASAQFQNLLRPFQTYKGMFAHEDCFFAFLCYNIFIALSFLTKVYFPTYLYREPRWHRHPHFVGSSVNTAVSSKILSYPLLVKRQLLYNVIYYI